MFNVHALLCGSFVGVSDNVRSLCKYRVLWVELGDIWRQERNNSVVNLILILDMFGFHVPYFCCTSVFRYRYQPWKRGRGIAKQHLSPQNVQRLIMQRFHSTKNRTYLLAIKSGLNALPCGRLWRVFAWRRCINTKTCGESVMWNIFTMYIVLYHWNG
jgi:hypothetical protein